LPSWQLNSGTAMDLIFLLLVGALGVGMLLARLKRRKTN
jgi:hypothetical protein